MTGYEEEMTPEILSLYNLESFKRKTLSETLETEKDISNKEILSVGSVEPRFIAVDKNDDVRVIELGPFMANEMMKDAVANAFRAYAKMFNIVRYAHVSEAWTATMNRGDDMRPPSQREDRREIVAILVSDEKGELMSVREILRDNEGKVSGLGPEEIKIDTYEKIGGRFAGLLRDEDE